MSIQFSDMKVKALRNIIAAYNATKTDPAVLMKNIRFK